MKKNLFSILFVLIAFTSMAQLQKGTKMIGGNLGFSFSGDKEKYGNTTTDRWKHSSVYLNPNVGLFLIDHLAIGVKMNLSSSSNRLPDGLNLGNGNRADSRNNTLDFTLGPWVRYYLPIGDKAAFFGEANSALGGSRYKFKRVEGNRVVSVTQPTSAVFNFGVGPGFSYFLTPNVGLEGLLQFRVNRRANDNEATNVREISTTAGFYFNVGLQVYIP